MSESGRRWPWIMAAACVLSCALGWFARDAVYGVRDRAVTWYREGVAFRSIGRGQLPHGVLRELRRGPVPVVDGLSLIYAESRGVAGARSRDGGLGLCQVGSNVAHKYGYRHREMLDPTKNVRVGMLHYQASLVVWHSNTTNALGSWNCGMVGWRAQLNAKTMPAPTRQLIGRFVATKRRLGTWMETGRFIPE